ncbi:hypothetical protein [Propionivibrio sp.]|uniref:hypothetical protein n=1 Tax=Propionivibrio sp. TaxID=2212460 RepID=UPI0025E59649|nr:hypothetical protein [Propionivibrio sp.]
MWQIASARELWLVNPRIKAPRLMTRANDNPYRAQQRTRIASAAARLIAEDGISDYALAKRKAANHLGFPDNVHLPENAEVEAELRIYQRLFQDVEQIARVTCLRQKASGIMSKMLKFNPYLTGSVLDGTAARFAEIDIQLFTDSAKDVEIFLLNQGIDYEHSTPRSERAETVLTIHDEDALVNLVVYPSQEERVTFKTRDGRNRQRARLDAVNKLLIASRMDSR